MGPSIKNIQNSSPDGKYHVVPLSGDLHIIRADFSDTVENYACRVRNTLNNREEISPPFNLLINGEISIPPAKIHAVFSIWDTVIPPRP